MVKIVDVKGLTIDKSLRALWLRVLPKLTELLGEADEQAPEAKPRKPAA